METIRARITFDTALLVAAAALFLIGAAFLAHVANEPVPYKVCQTDGIYHPCPRATPAP